MRRLQGIWRIGALNPWIVIATVACAVFFLSYPKTDIVFTQAFYTPEAGFYLRDAWWVAVGYHGLPWLVRVIVIGVFLVMIAKRFALLGCAPRISYRAMCYVLLCLAIGPGLLVNGVFKEHWDRARPNQVEVFGGTRQFTPPLLVADQCERNCSFVSGHSAAGFCLVMFGFLARQRKWRVSWFVGGTLLGAGIGFVRIVQGGHFLSDVIFSGFFVSMLCRIIYNAMYSPRPTTSV